MHRLPIPPKLTNTVRRDRLADFAFLLGTFLLLYGIARVGAGFFVSFKPPVDEPKVSLDPVNLPYYAARSTLRMFLALGLSILFTLTYGYAAAKSKRAERVLVPLLDVLQSVPVLGFLSITVTGFVALFPGSLFGLECASIFAIFTGQAWNMAFSFYNSLITLPRELDETAKIFKFSPWRRFISVEVPAAMIGLVWNGMMSFGGGWFFVAASEAISVLNHQYTLPGIGSYVQKAIENQDLRALGAAIITMAIVIIVVDQLFWKPIVAWAEKFRMERSTSGVQAESWLLDLLRASHIPRNLSRWWRKTRENLPKPKLTAPKLLKERRRAWRNPANDDLVFGLLVGGLIVAGLISGIRFVSNEVSLKEVFTSFGLGVLTLLRVFALIVVSTVIWVPIGVAIGFHPKLAKVMQPIAQLMASFPANFLFPAATIFFLRFHIPLNFGSILLMALGSQWYLLFNAIAGAMAVPSDLREMTTSLNIRGKQLWRQMIIPAIFPAWVTGAITASGGAWNASIVSEVVTWGNDRLSAYGLGSYVAEATAKGDWPRIVLGVLLMCVFVVGANRLLWRRLYRLAENRYRLG